MSLETFLNNDIQNPFHLGILLTLYSGLRIGEICALQWQDFDFRNGTIMISKTLYRIQTENPDNNQKTKIIIESPKTESSIRVIPLPSFILNICINNCGKNQCYVLTGTEKYMEPRLCLKKFKNILKELGFSNYTFHTLRHTFATRCVENGFDVKSLSEILGHSNINTTMQRYVHPSLEFKQRNMDRLESISIFGDMDNEGNGN